MVNIFIVGLRGLIIAVIVVFSLSDLYPADTLRVAGYEQNINEH